jgi:predicted O-methyltransferase YrrM
MNMQEMDRQRKLDDITRTSRCGDPADGLNSTIGLLAMIAYAMPRRVLELGCDMGVSTECFLLTCEHVVAVDPWVDEHGGDHSDREAMFHDRCDRYGHLTLVKGYSPEALRSMPLGYFDLVYIDAIHQADAVRADIEASMPLVRDGGWIAGHDYRYKASPENAALLGAHVDLGDGWYGNNEHDIVPAINEIFGGENVKSFSDGSWLVRKPS